MWSKSLLMKSFMTSINQLRIVCRKHTLHSTKNEIFDWSFVHAEVGYHEISTSIITDQISFPIKVTWQVDNIVNQLNFFKWYSLTKLFRKLEIWERLISCPWKFVINLQWTLQVPPHAHITSGIKLGNAARLLANNQKLLRLLKRNDKLSIQYVNANVFVQRLQVKMQTNC